jgi:hypothetical protein
MEASSTWQRSRVSPEEQTSAQFELRASHSGTLKFMA